MQYLLRLFLKSKGIFTDIPYPVLSLFWCNVYLLYTYTFKSILYISFYSTCTVDFLFIPMGSFLWLQGFFYKSMRTVFSEYPIAWIFARILKTVLLLRDPTAMEIICVIQQYKSACNCTLNKENSLSMVSGPMCSDQKLPYWPDH